MPTWKSGRKHHGVKFSSRKELVRSPHVQSLYEGIVEELNRNLAQYEKLKKVLVIHEELSIADGTLTPSMKLAPPPSGSALSQRDRRALRQRADSHPLPFPGDKVSSRIPNSGLTA